MLATSIFFCHHNVFYSSKRKCPFWSHMYHLVSRCFHYGLFIYKKSSSPGSRYCFSKSNLKKKKPPSIMDSSQWVTKFPIRHSSGYSIIPFIMFYPFKDISNHLCHILFDFNKSLEAEFPSNFMW